MTQVARIFFGFLGVLFLLFAYWQLNDLDPEIWVSIYGFTALICGLAAFERFYFPVTVVICIGAFVGGIYFFPPSVKEWIISEWQQADLSMKTLDMEKARESFGLLIVSAVMGLTAYIGWRHKQKADKKI